MKNGDKIQFKDANNGRLYTGRIVKKYADRLLVRLFRGSVVITEDQIICEKAAPAKPVAPTAAEYKLFASTVFEMAVRWRDNWTSIVSGKKLPKRDYDACHGGHYKSRGFWGTRLFPKNCHAITKDENNKMHLGDVSVIEKYRAYMVYTYGPDILNEIEDMAAQPQKLSVSFLQDSCREAYAYLNSFCDADKELKWRIDKWRKSEREKMYRVKDFLCL